jgi:hypothetical protein
LAGKALRGACDVGMVNPFLDRPVSANGQEKVATDISSERWAEPFPRTGGRRSACSEAIAPAGLLQGWMGVEVRASGLPYLCPAVAAVAG